MTEAPFDRIRIAGIEVDCIVGINEWERLAMQRISLDITLHADIAAAGRSDRIADTVNYRTMTHRIVDEVRQSSYGLVEALAEHVARICLDDRRVQRVDVSVRKPGAVRFAEYVGVDITREQSAQ